MLTRTTLVVLILAALCVVLAPAVMAQQFQRPTPEETVAQLEPVLALSADQKARILKIYADAASGGQGGGRGGFMGGRLTGEIEAVLTADQVKKYRAFTFQQSVERRIDQIDRAVTLTADQKKKIVPVIEKEITAQTALMAGMGEGGDRQGMMEKMQALREDTSAALKGILTPAQMTSFSEMRGFGGRRNQ